MPSPQRQLGMLRPLLYAVAAALLVIILSLAQAVLMPLALAGLVGFILIPPVATLERVGLPRAASITLVMAVVVGAVAIFGYVLSLQFNDFATHMPEYATSIKAKLVALREARKDAIGQIEETVEKVANDLDKPQAPGQPQRVAVVPNQPTDVERLRMLLEPVLRPVATAGLVLILVVFVLAQREDIRNRLIRLVGNGRVTVTTRTLEEAGQRISRYLFSQSVINAIFGVVITVGLFFIGVPYALLWGVSAALLRFVPYLGSMLAMLMPASLAFVGSTGWAPTLQTLALFLSMDVVTAYVIEPVLIGTRTGISSLALLVSAMFWTWLWGPVGLLLSTPFTVCLAAMGKYIPEVEFLDVLLGDDPPLEAQVSLYQRLLAGDEDEATGILEKELRQNSREDVFDQVVVPSLLLADRDRLRDAISDAEHHFVTHTILEIVRNAPEAATPPERAAGEVPQQFLLQRSILGVPARTMSDQVALEMLGQVLGKRWTLVQLSTATLASEVLLAMKENPPDVVCITAQPPGGLSHARYLSKRIHEGFPAIPVCVLRAGVPVAAGEGTQPWGDGVQAIASSFAGVTTQLTQLVLLSTVPPVASIRDSTVSSTEAAPDLRLLGKRSAV